MEKLKVTLKWKDDEGIPCSRDCYVYHIPRIGETVDLDYHSGRVKRTNQRQSRRDRF